MLDSSESQLFRHQEIKLWHALVLLMQSSYGPFLFSIYLLLIFRFGDYLLYNAAPPPYRPLPLLLHLKTNLDAKRLSYHSRSYATLTHE